MVMAFAAAMLGKEDALACSMAENSRFFKRGSDSARSTKNCRTDGSLKRLRLEKGSLDLEGPYLAELPLLERASSLRRREPSSSPLEPYLLPREPSLLPPEELP